MFNNGYTIKYVLDDSICKIVLLDIPKKKLGIGSQTPIWFKN